MRTRADLVNRAAKFLGKLVAGQALESEDYASIDNEVDSIIDNLNARGITYIQDSQSIEDAGFVPLARIVAANVCTDFSVPLSSLAGFEGEPLRSEMQLRALGRDSKTSDRISFENF